MIDKLEFQIKQLERSIDIMATICTVKEFQEFCDHAYSCISYLKQEQVKLEKKESHE